MLAGNLASIGVGAIISTAASLIWPDDFDFEATRAINKPVLSDSSPSTPTEGKEEAGITDKPVSIAGDSFDVKEEADELDPVALNKAFKFATWSSVGLFVVLILLVPLPLFFSQHVYTLGGFTGWISVGIVWTFLSSFTVVVYPLYESRRALYLIAKGVYTDLFTSNSGKHVEKPTRKVESV